MADERTYGFNHDDAEATIQNIEARETWFPEIKPRGGSGIRLSHGIVLSRCDGVCNTYIVRRVRRTMSTDCESGSGSG